MCQQTGATRITISVLVFFLIIAQDHHHYHNNIISIRAVEHRPGLEVESVQSRTAPPGG